MIEFRQLFEKESSTYTYLLADAASREAVLIDSVLETVERDLKLVEELGARLMWAIDTHVHADHLSSLGLLGKRTGCRIGLSHRSGATGKFEPLHEGQRIQFGGEALTVFETPGHTQGCLSYLADGRVFTGDALLVRGCGRTDFQEGDAGQLFDSVTKKLFTLPDATRVYPGHDYKGFMSTSIGEEKRLNPRLTKTRDEFITLMANLKLDPPKRVNEAVPFNLTL